MPEVSEGEARGRMRRLYHNLKATLHVPFVPDVFRCLAHTPTFLTLALEASRPNLLSVSFEQRADDLRASLSPDIRPPAPPSPITCRDLRSAAALLPVFHYVNVKLLLLVTAWQEALSERPITGRPSPDEGYIPPGISSYFPAKIPLPRIESAPPPLRDLLERIVRRHYFFSPPSDYRALSCAPTFLTAAWASLEPLQDEPWYPASARRLLSLADEHVHTLPYPLPLSPNSLLRSISEREAAAAIAILTSSRHLLPPLILDIELMTRLLDQELQRRR